MCLFHRTTAQDGGAIVVYSFCFHMAIANCSFMNASALYERGSIALYQNTDFLRISVFFFWRNHLTTRWRRNLFVSEQLFCKNIRLYISWHISIQGYGGAIAAYRENDNFGIIDSIFTRTISLYNGGAIYLNQKNYFVKLFDCTFRDTLLIDGSHRSVSK